MRLNQNPTFAVSPRNRAPRTSFRRQKIWRLILLCALGGAAPLGTPSTEVLAGAHLGSAPPKAVKKPPVTKLFADAQKLYQAGQYPKARAAYERLLHFYPAHLP